MTTPFEQFVNDEIGNRVASQETSNTAGYFPRYTGTSKLTTERSPAQVLTDIGAQTLDADLTAIAALTGTGHAVRTGADTWSLLKNNLSATASPGATDDSAAGYAVGSLWIDTTGDKSYICVDATTPVWNDLTSGSGSAPVDASYIVQTANATLTNEQALGALATGLLKNTTTTGVLSIAVAGTDYAAASHTHALTDLSDVTLTTPATRSLLMKSAGDWIDDVLVAGDIPDLSATYALASHTHPSTDITDFTEAAQDAVGAAMTDTAEIDFTYNDTANTISAAIFTDSIVVGRLHATATDVFFGRDTAAAGPGEEISVAAAKTLLDLSGTNSGDQTITLTGDVTGSGTGSFAATIAANAVSFAKMADIATDTLIGRDAAATGDPEAITVGGGISFTGAGALQTSAFTGDVTKAAGSTVLAIANDAVSFAEMQNAVSNSVLVGSGATGAGSDYVEIALGTNLSMSGTTLNATGGGASALNDLSDVTITLADAGDLLRYNGTAWVDYPDSNFAAASHVHSAADITTGLLSLARGGTGADLSATGGTGMFVLQTASGAALSVNTVSIDALANVSATSPSERALLMAIGGIWDDRFLTAADIPSLDTSKITTGTFGVARGGTGLATITADRVVTGAGTSALNITDLSYSAGVLARFSAGDATFRAASGSTSIFGEAGDITLGDVTLRTMKPATDAKIDLGTLTGPLRFHDLNLSNNVNIDLDGSATTGALRLGAGQDASLYFNGVDLYLDAPSPQKIRFLGQHCAFEASGTTGVILSSSGSLGPVVLKPEGSGPCNLDAQTTNIGRSGAVSKISLQGSADFVIDFATNDINFRQGGSLTHYPTAAASTTDLIIGGLIGRDFSSHAWSSGGGETQLAAITIAASLLDQTSEFIEVVAFGSYASNANSKTVKLRIDTVDLVNYAAGSTSSDKWTIRAIIAKSAASTLKGFGFISRNTFTKTFINTAMTVTLTAAFDVSIRANGSTTNDVILEGFLVRYL